ncbi:MAG: hypothetical protein K0Q66_2344 [Chitinophagaceae bacterium]|nr:hypothetical protein [Chitinophagaceae bacterium]
MAKLGEYLNENTDEYQLVKEKANRENAWFIPEFIDLASKNIANAFLDKEKLENWTRRYNVPAIQPTPRNVGVVMAGNIPLVGFHDLLCVFISGHRLTIKLSSKDEVLLKHLAAKLVEWDARVADNISLAERLTGCDAYIATGSNNSGRYFEHYFAKYPHIIRYNRTSVAILDGTESLQELELLADDICLYFGLGCRNVTKLFVPKDYDFVPLLASVKKYGHFQDHHKYKNNFDYHLALLMMGNKFYMTDGSTLFTEHTSPFTPVSQVHFEYYSDKQSVEAGLKDNKDVQAIVGHGFLPVGRAQQPALDDYADGVDTMQFLLSL